MFESPEDPIILDTGHQSYVHKLLTGRQDFRDLRSRNGLAGYPQRSESPHDIVESSHASSSLSWADGISRAFARTGRADRHVVAVVGDGALTGGMTWEALNNITDDNDRNLVIVVNDNGRSYAPTIGGMARFLNKVRTGTTYRDLDAKSGQAARALRQRSGARCYRGLRGGTRGFLSRFTNNNALYTQLDIKYLGPIDGHDLAALTETLELAKSYSAPVLVHVITEKGRGYEPARNDEADQFHSVGKIDPETGRPVAGGSGQSWTERVRARARRGRREARRRDRHHRGDAAADGARAVRRALPRPGLRRRHRRTARRDLSAAGLAYGGLHPVVALYATFVNRAFDQVLMDVALHKAGVTFVFDRSGVTGPDGPSHHGMWDLALLNIVPNIRIAAPRDGERLREELGEAVEVDDAPTVIRFPKGDVGDDIPALERLDDGVDVLFREGDEDVLLVGIGPFARTALDVAARLRAQGIGATVIDPRWVVPVAASLVDLAARHRLVITLEDGIRVGGIGTRVRQVLREASIDTAVDELGLPDQFIDHASRAEILEDTGLTPAKIAQDVVSQVLGTRVPVARPEAPRSATGAAEPVRRRTR